MKIHEMNKLFKLSTNIVKICPYKSGKIYREELEKDFFVKNFKNFNNNNYEQDIQNSKNWKKFKNWNE